MLNLAEVERGHF